MSEQGSDHSVVLLGPEDLAPSLMVLTPLGQNLSYLLGLDLLFTDDVAATLQVFSRLDVP